MPPKKSGFMCFVQAWKEKTNNKSITIAAAVLEASKVWANMSQREKDHYNQKAKNETFVAAAPKNRAQGPSSSRGVSKGKVELPIEERKELEVRNAIKKIVISAKENRALLSKPFIFMGVNYFCVCVDNNLMIPAEITLAEYSLERGIRRVKHMFVNPGKAIYGNSYEAQRHSDETHQLPLPPTTLSNLTFTDIYENILDFMHDVDPKKFQPLYIKDDLVDTAASVLEFLATRPETEKGPMLKVYPIKDLFFELKNAGDCLTVKSSENASYLRFVTESHFDRDYFEYCEGIACEFHEKLDKSRYCTQSMVYRWAFMFSEFLCKDFGFGLIPGRHCPKDVNTQELKKQGAKVLKEEDDSDVTSVASTQESGPVSSSDTFKKFMWKKNLEELFGTTSGCTSESDDSSFVLNKSTEDDLNETLKSHDISKKIWSPNDSLELTDSSDDSAPPGNKKNVKTRVQLVHMKKKKPISLKNSDNLITLTDLSEQDNSFDDGDDEDDDNPKNGTLSSLQSSISSKGFEEDPQPVMLPSKSKPGFAGINGPMKWGQPKAISDSDDEISFNSSLGSSSYKEDSKSRISESSKIYNHFNSIEEELDAFEFGTDESLPKSHEYLGEVGCSFRDIDSMQDTADWIEKNSRIFEDVVKPLMQSSKKSGKDEGKEVQHRQKPHFSFDDYDDDDDE